MDILETLIAMRGLLTPPGAWTQNASWRDKAGTPVQEMESATSYCLFGAAQRARGFLRVPDALCEFLNARVPDAFFFISWNDRDHRTQAEVLAFLDECIAELTPRLMGIVVKHTPINMMLDAYELEDA